jgi:hypothetical protein
MWVTVLDRTNAIKNLHQCGFPAASPPIEMPGHKTARVAQAQQFSTSGTLLHEYKSQRLGIWRMSNSIGGATRSDMNDG